MCSQVPKACWIKIPAYDILKYFLLLFPENKIWDLMQIVHWTL